ncbi:hypothetical protein ACFL2O_04515 [Thermodesulfobacteriota bacterium]
MLPAQSIRHLVICAGGIVAFIFLAIYPSQKSLTRLDKEIARIESQIEEQRILFPIAQELFSQVMKEETFALPFPDTKKLERDKLETVPSLLEDLASKSGLDIISIVPDVRSLTEYPGHLSITAVVKGKFSELRELVVKMGSLPYLEHVEEMSISPKEGVREFILKIWIAVKE